MAGNLCDCGHPMKIFLVEGEEFPDSYECCVCGQEYTVEKWVPAEEADAS